MTTLRNKLVLLKEHAQYMQNMLDAGQTLMNLDHDILTNLFNDCQPSQKKSLDYAERELKDKGETIAKLREALQEIDDTLKGDMPITKQVKDIARTILAETE